MKNILFSLSDLDLKNSVMFIENKFNSNLRGEIMKKLGLVVGRFQPLHDGHKFLIRMALQKNDEVVIVIGSAGKVDFERNPLSTDERYRRLYSFVKMIEVENRNIRIVFLKDIDSDEKWPEYLKNKSGITNETKNSFYTGDDNLPKEYLEAMEDIGFNIRIVKRNDFQYEDPSGEVHIIESATEIRNLHRKLNFAKM